MSGTSPGWLNCALFGLLGNGLFFFGSVCRACIGGRFGGCGYSLDGVCYLGEGRPSHVSHLLGSDSSAMSH